MTREQGFTLVELMVTLAIAAVLMGIAIPSFRDFLVRTTLITQTNDLVTALNLARSEAVKRGVRVTVCKSANPSASTPACSTSASWQEGVIVFVDNTQTTGNTRGVIDGADVVLRVAGPYTGTTLTAGANFARAVSYLPSGWSRGINSSGNDASPNDTFALCRSGVGRNIIINTTGRVTTAVVSSC